MGILKGMAMFTKQHKKKRGKKISIEEEKQVD